MSLKAGLIEGADGQARCQWSGTDALYQRYHDREWGRPLADNVRLFELSWITILRKRDNFRAAFRGFEIEAVAAFGALEVKRLLHDAGIVRHRGKIVSTINNARRAIDVIEEHGSLPRFYWSFPPGKERPRFKRP